MFQSGQLGDGLIRGNYVELKLVVNGESQKVSLIRTFNVGGESTNRVWHIQSNSGRNLIDG